MLNISIKTPEVQKLSPKITVVGVGGAGGNAVNNMISSALEGCEFLVCNTDAQALEGSLCDNRLQLGAHVTGGLGAGAKPEIGEKAAHESLDEVMQYLEGSNMAFITAGMGGGTGTGAAPVIAKACRDNGILTVGVVTKPFHFEGTHRMKQAEAGIEEMQDYVDTLIVIPNQNLFRVANEKTTFAEAFKMADGVLQSGVRGVTDLMVMPGLINLDFADIRSAMLEMGKAMMGTGEGEGDRRAIEAAEAAISNPLLDDVSMKGARGVIVNVTGGADMTLFEVDEACNRIRDEVDSNANIIFGSTFDDKLEGSMRVSVVATGIDAVASSRPLDGTRSTTIPTTKKPEVKTEATPAPTSATKTATAASLASTLPQTEVARAMTLNARKDTQPSVQATTASTDMFEQQELHAPQTVIQAPVSVPTVAAVQPISTPAVPRVAPATARTTGDMRGQVHQGNFIPPSPIVPEPQDEVSYAAAGQQAPQAQSFHAEPSVPQKPQRSFATRNEANTATAEVSQAEQQNVVAAVGGLVLTPPVPGARAAERRKAPSLLERITGAYGQVRNDVTDALTSSEEEGEATGTETQGGGFTSGLSANKTAPNASPNPSQGKLNIDAPSAPAKATEEDLDIPAFLRRQAN